MLGGSEVNTGIWARRAALRISSVAIETVTSPLIQMASTLRAMSELAASRAAVLFSAFASTRVRLRSAHTLRAIFVCASELASAGFQTRPTDLSSGRI